MNKERVARLIKEIKYLEKELSKELGFTRTTNMLRGLGRWVEALQASKAGFNTVKEWKHSLEEKK